MEPRQQRRDHQYYEDLVGAVALGAATPEERQALLTHASECPICRPELAELRAAVTALPLMLEEREPSPILRYRIQAMLQHELTTGVPIAEPASGPLDVDQLEDSEASPFAAAPYTAVPEPTPVPIRPRRPRAVAIWAAAAVLLLAVSAGLVLWNLMLLQDQRDLGEEETIAVTVDIASPPANLAANLTYLEDRGVFLLSVRDLPALTEDQLFQVWLIGDANPISVGTFGSETAEVAVAADRAEYAALAVSVEPGPTGSPTPTTPPILVANLVDEAAADAWSQSTTATSETEERTTEAPPPDDEERGASRAEDTGARGTRAGQQRAEQERTESVTRANPASDPADGPASISGSSGSSDTSGGASESDASGGNSGGSGASGDDTSEGAGDGEPDDGAAGGGDGASGGAVPSGGEPVVNDVEESVEEAVQVPRVVPTIVPVEVPELVPTLPL